jgi:hypothetical protein
MTDQNVEGGLDNVKVQLQYKMQAGDSSKILLTIHHTNWTVTQKTTIQIIHLHSIIYYCGIAEWHIDGTHL